MNAYRSLLLDHKSSFTQFYTVFMKDGTMKFFRVESEKTLREIMAESRVDLTTVYVISKEVDDSEWKKHVSPKGGGK